MGDRLQNERKFTYWEPLASGGRRYVLTITGRHGWSARYIKEVDTNETTVKFYQEILNEKGIVVERHEKYPIDHGHVKAGD